MEVRSTTNNQNDAAQTHHRRTPSIMLSAEELKNLGMGSLPSSEELEREFEESSSDDDEMDTPLEEESEDENDPVPPGIGNNFTGSRKTGAPQETGPKISQNSKPKKTKLGKRKFRLAPEQKTIGLLFLGLIFLTGIIITGMAMGGQMGENFLSQQKAIGAAFLIPGAIGLAGSGYALITKPKESKKPENKATRV